jgi:hypothetical protein
MDAGLFVAAVVNPITPPRSRMIAPATRKPMPGMICAAMRVWSPTAVLTGGSSGEQRKYRSANTDEHVRGKARWFVVGCPLKAHDSAEKGSEDAT